MKIRSRLGLPLVCAGLVLPAGCSLPVMAAPAPQTLEQSNAKHKTVQFRIAGMTCAAGAKGLEASFRNMVGVVKADVDYKAGQAIVTFDAAKQSADSLSKFVMKCGYQVKETKLV
jgi:copper chaperone CopZ